MTLEDSGALETRGSTVGATGTPAVKVTGQMVVETEMSSVVRAPFPGQSLSLGAQDVTV